MLYALDCTSVAIEKAKKQGCNVIITHHPLVYKPLGSVAYTDSVGKRVIECIKNDIAVISFHTRLDIIENGVNDTLAAKLGIKNTESFKDENIKVHFIGDRTPLAEDIKELMLKAENDSKNATGLTLNIAINYGGRDEIVHAVKNIIKSGICENDITEDLISQNLYTATQPDPDFIIRPSGEYRLSNYLIWQSAYAEYWFSDILWPDFSPKHLEKAIEDYNKRNRRFGGI